MSERRLGDLPVGQTATIESLSGDPAVVQRLLEMGLTPGTDVTVVRLAPLGDPMEVLVRGYNLSIRRADAASLLLRSSP